MCLHRALVHITLFYNKVHKIWNPKVLCEVAGVCTISQDMNPARSGPENTKDAIRKPEGLYDRVHSPLLHPKQLDFTYHDYLDVGLT